MEIYRQDSYKGYTIKVVMDPTPFNPRYEGWHFSLMVMRGGYGDRADLPMADSMREQIEALKQTMGKDMVYLQIRRYEHSGVALRAYEPGQEVRGYPWDCPWDSGWAGVIVASRDQIRHEYQCKRVTKSVIERVYTVFRAEVEEYGAYLNGDVYGYVIEDADGNYKDSCYGFYGDTNYCIAQAKVAIEHLIEVSKEEVA